MVDKNFCMSSYLAFRYVASQGVGFSETLIPQYPQKPTNLIQSVASADDIDAAIRQVLEERFDKQTGILLSGGIDSAILASYLPKGTKAYSIRFAAPDAVDETLMASLYARQYSLDFHVVEVTWEDYLKSGPALMKRRRAPLHQIECAVYAAAKKAKADGIHKLLMGNGSDYLFGGLTGLLSKDWTFDELVERYTMVKPEQALTNPVSVVPVYERFRTGSNSIDLFGFLEQIHGIASIPSFENPLSLAGVQSLEPYEAMHLSVPLDLDRIRGGESKYLIRELFSRKYPQIAAPDKIPFKRPMDQWLANWRGPVRPEFIKGCTASMTGDQKWLVFCLEWFLDLMEEGVL
ncbi:MAG: asparagine synthase C-terminal domain-containing protein [Clostridium sp.]|nr:asparagine synthase C-terminal domain-containing protein [Clostridium sp.]